MDDIETQQLIAAIEKLGKGIQTAATQRYTLTGAADWPILVIAAGVVLGLLAIMWADLKTTIKDHRGEWRQELKAEADLIWAEIRRLQDKFTK